MLVPATAPPLLPGFACHLSPRFRGYRGVSTRRPLAFLHHHCRLTQRQGRRSRCALRALTRQLTFIFWETTLTAYMSTTAAQQHWPDRQRAEGPTRGACQLTLCFCRLYFFGTTFTAYLSVCTSLVTSSQEPAEPSTAYRIRRLPRLSWSFLLRPTQYEYRVLTP